MSTSHDDATQPMATSSGASSAALDGDRSGTGAPGVRVGKPSGVTTSVAPRQAKLRVQRVDPLSVLKLSFLLSVAAGIAGVVLVAVLWMILNGMGVFSAINDMILSLLPQGKQFSLMDYVGFGRVIPISIVISFINVVLMTALATLAAFLYNICAGLVGGIKVTLTDD